MKTSRYNYIVNKGENLYCFNALSKAFFTIKQERKSLLEGLLSNPNFLEQILPSFQEKMKQGGFIVPDDYDELQIIRNMHKQACNAPLLSLIILPTLNCNFHCWYCYESHTPTQMDVSTMYALQSYIYNRLNSGEIKEMNISWFGGEPFLYYHKVMQPILSYVHRLCEQLQIPFASSATTNGFLITEEIARELGKYNVNSFQITLDGKREYHNNVRHSLQKSSFDTILQNVNDICALNPKAHILLRVNYDDHNLEPDAILQEVCELTPETNRNQISFLLRRVWQIPAFEEEEIKKQQFIRLLNLNGFSYSYEYDIIHNFIPCYSSRKNTLMVTHDGLVGKCTTRDDFSQYAIGTLTQDGAISWKDEKLNDLYATPLFENPECLSCKQLPICMGSCPKIIRKDGTIDYQAGQCNKQRNENELENLILNYCQSFKN